MCVCVCVCVCTPHVCVKAQLGLTLCYPMTEALQAPLFMEFSRYEYWSRLPFPTPGDLPNPGIEPGLLCLLPLTGEFIPRRVPPGKPKWKEMYAYSSDGTESTCNAEDLGSIPGLGRSPGGGHGNPLQYSCLENPHGQRSLAGYSPQGHKEPETSEWLSRAHTYIFNIFIFVQCYMNIFSFYFMCCYGLEKHFCSLHST